MNPYSVLCKSTEVKSLPAHVLRSTDKKNLNLSFGPLCNYEVVITWQDDEDKTPLNTKLDIK